MRSVHGAGHTLWYLDAAVFTAPQSIKVLSSGADLRRLLSRGRLLRRRRPVHILSPAAVRTRLSDPVNDRWAAAAAAALLAVLSSAAAQYE